MSGGNLEMAKCLWYLYFPIPNQQNEIKPAPKSFLAENDAKIDIFDNESNQTHRIALLDATEGHRTLGCHKSIDENTAL